MNFNGYWYIMCKVCESLDHDFNVLNFSYDIAKILLGVGFKHMELGFIVLGWVMVFNATFNNFSVISWEYIYIVCVCTW